MNRLSIFAGAGVVVLIVLISVLVIVLPREEPTQVQTSPATTGRNFIALPEKPLTNDGKPFKPDWD